MSGSLRIHITERQAEIVFIDDLCFNLPVDNLLENGHFDILPISGAKSKEPN
jgi:hypothetical protein